MSIDNIIIIKPFNYYIMKTLKNIFTITNLYLFIIKALGLFLILLAFAMFAMALNFNV